MKRINIIGFNNGKGLSKDIELLKRELSYFDIEIRPVEISERINISYSQKMYSFSKAILTNHLPFKRKQEINIFLERIVPDLLGESEVNLLIPNPEWFHPAWRFLSGGIDIVLCKTRNAINTYNRLGFRTQYISFTSFDRNDAASETKEVRVLHVAGGSLFKGTKNLLHLWEKHPEWPQLEVITHRVMSDYRSDAANISIKNKYIDDAQLIKLQNKCLFHACPSEAEGFGHYINEGMSCGAIVFTTDAPPMNEIVTSDNGFLVNCHISGRNCLSNLVQFCETDFEYKLNLAFNESLDDRCLRSANARKAYIERDILFRDNLRSVISKFL